MVQAQCSGTLQDICSGSVAGIIHPSYCNHTNPFVVPFPFSDLDFEAETFEPPYCFDPITGLPSNDVATSECEIVKAISAAEFGPFAFVDPKTGHNVTGGVRYTLFGMRSGTLYAVNFNTNELIPLKTFGFNGSSIKKLISVVLAPQKTMGLHHFSG